MDVRCERCRAQYVFDDEQITPSGLAVQCTNCGHLFWVKKKELVVTVAVKPGELEGVPLPANAVGPRSAGQAAPPKPAPGAEPGRPREWRLRLVSGEVLAFRELTTLQKWIVEGRVSREDELSGASEGFRRLGGIAELAPFFEVVEAAERGRLKGTTEPGMRSVQSGPTGHALPPPPSGFPPPSFTQPRPAPPPPLPPPPHRSLPTLVLPTSPPGPATDRAPPAPSADVSSPRASPPSPPSRPQAVRPGLVLLLLAVGGGAALYAFAPGLLGLAPHRVAPAELEVRSPPPERPPAEKALEPATAIPAAPPAETEPETETETAPEPEPAGSAEPGHPEGSSDASASARSESAAPPRPKAGLSEADRLRARGDCARALDLYGRLLSRNPEHLRALTGRGLCYLDEEQYGPAEASFQTALAVDPRAADALLGLAETYRWQGRTADAITYYEKYLAEHPDGEDAPVARNAVDTLRR